MDWQTCMNRAMKYIDDNLSEKIDYAAAAQFMNCSEWEFRRIFSFITTIPLSEYIRRRRLTEAVSDIQNGWRIIDIAQRYGYDSQAAFSRAFRQWHGVTPSMARDKQAKLKLFPCLTFKLFLMEGIGMGGDSGQRTNIIGAGEAGCAVSVEMDRDMIHETNSIFWDVKGNDIIGTTALPSYGAFASEEELRLFGDVSDKKILEIACGRGHSLQYLGERNAAELWGMDISKEQIEKTKVYLTECGLSAELICAPMEEECGIPADYFDIVYSVYGIGWTTDLDSTLSRIASYLKKDGAFIFSWSHPIHKCVAAEYGSLLFKKCYFDESWYSVSIGGGVLSLSDRKLSTYVNALAKAGFVIEQMIEPANDGAANPEESDFAGKMRMLPAAFIIKARKL